MIKQVTRSLISGLGNSPVFFQAEMEKMDTSGQRKGSDLAIVSTEEELLQLKLGRLKKNEVRNRRIMQSGTKSKCENKKRLKKK